MKEDAGLRSYCEMKEACALYEDTSKFLIIFAKRGMRAVQGCALYPECFCLSIHGILKR